MTTFFVENLDFVYLIYGLVFFFLATVTISMAQIRGQGVSWIWLGLFAILHGINEWLDLLAPVLGKADLFEFIRTLLLVLSFLFLLEFGRRNVLWSGSRKAGVWIYLPPVVLLAGVVSRFGVEEVVSVVRYVLAFPGGVLAAMALWQWGAPDEGKPRAYRHVVAPLAMACYAVLSGLVVPKVDFGTAGCLNSENFLAVTGVPVQLLRCGVACMIALVVWYEHFIWRVERFSGSAIKWIVRLECVSAVLALAILIGGFMAVSRVQQHAVEEMQTGMMKLGQLIGSSINPAHVAELKAGAEDLESPAFIRLRDQFRRMADAATDIRYIYLLRKSAGDIRFLLDVEPRRGQETSLVPTSLPGDVYQDAPPEVERVFESGVALLSRPYVDHWGSFVSAFTPILDPGSGRVAAVLGVDQLSSKWKQNLLRDRLPPLLITALVILLVLMFTAIWVRLGEDAEIKHYALQRARQQQEVLWDLANSSDFSEGREFTTWRQISEKTGHTIGADQVKILVHDPDKVEFRVEDAFEPVRETHVSGEPLSGGKYAVLKVVYDEGRTLTVDDITADSRFPDLKAWFIESGIRSAILAPFRASSRIGGLLIVSQSGTGRKWLPDEVRFATEVADLVSHSLVNRERDRAEKALTKAHEELELRVRERTEELSQRNQQLKQEIEERLRGEAEREKLEAQVRQTQKLESLGVMAGGIAHDFNNILMAILGNAELAKMETEPGDPVRSYIHDIESAASRAATLSRQMLAYSGRGHSQVQAIDMNALVRDMVGMLEVSVSKKVSILYALEEGLKTLDGDVAQIGQIVMNLVINAAEAIGDEVGTITIQTGTIWCDAGMLVSMWMNEPLPEGEYVYFEVRDTGCGMAPETLSRIFDPFFTTKFTGRGLGLAAVLGIVRGHHGTIDVCSEKGYGTTFRVLFPVGRLVSKVRPAKVVEKGQPFGHGTILLVDDEEPVRDLGKKLIERLGFSALVASDGLDAIAVFRKHQAEIRCVLMDLTMPQVDGQQAMMELRKLDPGVKVIICSGYTEEDVSMRFADWNVSGFLQKPYTFEVLATQLEATLGQNADGGV